MMNDLTVVVVGATGAVGQEMIRCLYELNTPVTNLRLAASARSVGKIVMTPFGDIIVEELKESTFVGCDIALFSAGGQISRDYREVCVNAGCLMIDNSSAFRGDPDVPLVVPEINAEAAQDHKGVIANPNCTTAIAAVVLHPIYSEFGIQRAIVSTYQATSGAGQNGMNELVDQLRAFVEERDLDVNVFQHQIAFNIIPHIDVFTENGYTKEEMKVTNEMRKIFNDDDLNISCTAVRIPTLRAHSESIVLETRDPVSSERVREILESSEGVRVVDNPSKNLYPMPLNVSGNFEVEVGRIRQNLVFGDRGIELFLSGDQLLKGAALNAVQIANLFVN